MHLIFYGQSTISGYNILCDVSVIWNTIDKIKFFCNFSKDYHLNRSATKDSCYVSITIHIPLKLLSFWINFIRMQKNTSYDASTERNVVQSYKWQFTIWVESCWKLVERHFIVSVKFRLFKKEKVRIHRSWRRFMLSASNIYRVNSFVIFLLFRFFAIFLQRSMHKHIRSCKY